MTCLKMCDFGVKNNTQDRCCCTDDEAGQFPPICTPPREIVTSELHCNEIGCVDGLPMYCLPGQRPSGEICHMACPVGYTLDASGACVADAVPPGPAPSVGCYNCTPVYTPAGCSTAPVEPNYDPTCSITDWNCPANCQEQGICTANACCVPDRLCQAGAGGVGNNPVTDRQCQPIINGSGLVSGVEQRICDTCLGSQAGGPVDDPCRIGVNAGVACLTLAARQ